MSALARFAPRWLTGSARRTDTGPIGINLGLDQIHLVQLRRDAGGRITVAARASVGYPATRDEAFGAPATLTPLLSAALRSAPFGGRHAVAALPGGAFRTLSLTYKVQSGQSEARAILSLMRDRLEGDPSDYVIDYVPVRSRTRDTERMALVAASPRAQVMRFLEALRKAGLTIEALEIGPVSVRRLVNALPGQSSDDNVVVVNTGREVSYVTALAGRRLLCDQAFRFGEQALLARLADALDMSPDAAGDLVMRTGLEPLPRADQVSVALNESGVFNTLLEIIKPELMRLVGEIERAVLFTSSETHGGKISRIYLAGALARWRGVANALGAIVGLQVQNLDEPLAAFQSDGTGASPDLAVPIGLALRGLADDD